MLHTSDELMIGSDHARDHGLSAVNG